MKRKRSLWSYSNSPIKKNPYLIPKTTNLENKKSYNLDSGYWVSLLDSIKKNLSA
jgi:hypothetical protein